MQIKFTYILLNLSASDRYLGLNPEMDANEYSYSVYHEILIDHTAHYFKVGKDNLLSKITAKEFFELKELTNKILKND